MTEGFRQDTAAAQRAATIIENAAKEIGVDGDTGHVGTLRKLLDDLAREWHAGASEDHRTTMIKWNASVTRLAELTRTISIDLRTGTDSLDTKTKSLNLEGGDRFSRGLAGPQQ